MERERSHGQGGWREGQSAGQEREHGRHQPPPPRDRFERDGDRDHREWQRESEWRGSPQRQEHYGQGRSGYSEPGYEQQRLEQERQGHESQHERGYERQGSERHGHGQGQSWYGQGSQGHSSQGFGAEDYGRRQREPQRYQPVEPPGYGAWGQGGSQRSPYPSSGNYGTSGGSHGTGVSGMGSYGAKYGYHMGAGQFGGEREMGRERQPRRGRPPRSYKRGDERIRDEICELIARDSDIDASEVDIQVMNGEVTLSGTVEDRSAKRDLEDLAERVFGVSDVHNNLKARRSLLTEIGDKLFGNGNGGGGTPTASKNPPTM